MRAYAALRRKRRLEWPLVVLWCLLLAQANCLEVPIARRQHLERRSSPEALQKWALIEAERIKVKYDASGGSTLTPLLRPRQEGNAFSASAAAASSSESIALASQSAQLSSRVASASASASRSVGQVQMTNYQSDLEYYAPLRIGTPAIPYNVILDTGSADLWLAAANCSSTQCGIVPRVNPSNSSTSQNLARAFSIRYGVGSASGAMFADNMTIANRNLSSQPFAVCDQVTTTLLSGNVSGLMGLGWQPLAASGLKPLWQNLLDAELAANDSSVTFPGFAFALTRFVNVSGASLNEFGGIFSIGTLSNASFTGNISFIDIPSNMQSYWLIPLDAVLFNGTDLPNVGAPNAAIDTGTTLIGGPQSVISDLYSRIPGSQPASGQFAGYYTFPCSANVSIALTFGGITYNITAADFNLGPFVSATATAPAMCLGAFFDLTLSAGSSSVISWVVGDAFLKNVYSVYRYLPTPAVGFAALSSSFLAINPTGGIALAPSRSASLSFIVPQPTQLASTLPATADQVKGVTASLTITSSAKRAGLALHRWTLASLVTIHASRTLYAL